MIASVMPHFARYAPISGFGQPLYQLIAVCQSGVQYGQLLVVQLVGTGAAVQMPASTSLPGSTSGIFSQATGQHWPAIITDRSPRSHCGQSTPPQPASIAGTLVPASSEALLECEA